MSTDGNEGQESWSPGGSGWTPSRASETRSGIRQHKALQKAFIGSLEHQTSLLDARKHAQVLVGPLEAAQTQQQEMYQMVLEQVQAHLAEELSNWRTEQQIHEEIYFERITKLELEVGNQLPTKSDKKSRQKPKFADLATLLSTRRTGMAGDYQEEAEKSTNPGSSCSYST